MLKGNISNEWSKAIVIDVDGLVIQPKVVGPFKLREELTEQASKVLHGLFKYDLSVYLVYNRKYTGASERVQKLLEDHYLPYTRFYSVTSPAELDDVVNQSHVIRYFLHNSLPDRITMISSGKAVMIENLMEVSQYL
jgi:hypothetical protein